MTDTNILFDNAELALAAYADLIPGESTLSQKQKLKEAGMTDTQAIQFAARYPEVFEHIPNTASGFSATVFKDTKDTNGELTIAFRGTEGLGIDLFEADLGQILPYGAAYNQIVDMYNWWRRVSTSSGPVEQFGIQPYLEGIDSVPAGAVLLYSKYGSGQAPIRTMYYLIPEGSVQATGELGSEADVTSLDLTGHSLGGHLSIAFNALFGSNVNQVTTFNAPGFINSTANQNFFAALGGHVPNETDVINIVADEANTGDDPLVLISGLHSVPGTTTEIAIENQLNPSEPDWANSLNHSQMILTDSLAVYNLLAQLDPSLTEAEYDHIFQASDNQTYQTLESIVDSLNRLFGISSTPLSTGDDEREALYSAIYGIKGNAFYQLLSGDASISTVPSNIASLAAENTQAGRGYRYALATLQPFVITGDLTGTTADDVAYNLNDGNGDRIYSDQYLQDRSKFLSLILTRNTQDITSVATVIPLNDGLAEIFTDIKTGQEIQTVFGSLTADQIIFGANDGDTIDGGADNDYISGGWGDDTLLGGGGNDHIRGDAYYYQAVNRAAPDVNDPWYWWKLNPSLTLAVTQNYLYRVA